MRGTVALAVALPALAPVAGAEPHTYVVDAAASSVVVHVGKAGLFRFAGHEHAVVASRLAGQVIALPDDLARSSVSLTFDAPGLRVLEKDEPEGDAPKVQAVMEGPKVLDVVRFPTIAFVSRSVAGKPAGSGVYALSVAGDLTLHGTTLRVSVPVQVELQGDSLKASGHVPLKQTAFGMIPVSVAGVVKVKDEVAIDFTIVARSSPRGE